MICLEMVGYACNEPGCQHYPFPLRFFGYPEKGNFIGIVGNLKSGNFTKALFDEFQNNHELPSRTSNVAAIFKDELILQKDYFNGRNRK